MEVVLNEYEWVENSVKNLRMGKQPWITLDRYAKYLYAQGRSRAEIRSAINDFVARCCPNERLDVIWSRMIDRCVSNAKSRKLLQINGVSITKAELELIGSQNGSVKQKVLFTMLCLAKFRNAARGDNSNWIKYDVKDIFSLANAGYSARRQLDMIHSFYKDGLIGLSSRVGNTSIKVKFVCDDSEEVLYVTDFRNLGNQYSRIRFKNKYIECDSCGLVVPRNSNRQLYCKACADALNVERALERYYEKIS